MIRFRDLPTAAHLESLRILISCIYMYIKIKRLYSLKHISLAGPQLCFFINTVCVWYIEYKTQKRLFQILFHCMLFGLNVFIHLLLYMYNMYIQKLSTEFAINICFMLSFLRYIFCLSYLTKCTVFFWGGGCTSRIMNWSWYSGFR